MSIYLMYNLVVAVVGVCDYMMWLLCWLKELSIVDQKQGSGSGRRGGGDAGGRGGEDGRCMFYTA